MKTPDAFNIVLDLAEQNVLDQTPTPELQAQREKQIEALASVKAYREAYGTDTTSLYTVAGYYLATGQGYTQTVQAPSAEIAVRRTLEVCAINNNFETRGLNFYGDELHTLVDAIGLEIVSVAEGEREELIGLTSLE